MNPVVSTVIVVLFVLAALQLFGGLGTQIVNLFEILLVVGLIVLVIVLVAAAINGRRGGRERIVLAKRGRSWNEERERPRKHSVYADPEKEELEYDDID